MTRSMTLSIPLNIFNHTWRRLGHMDISAQGLKMFLEFKKYHTKPNGTFLVNIFILNFSICCSSSSFSFFILTRVHW
jgi:hypothetical protein